MMNYLNPKQKRGKGLQKDYIKRGVYNRVDRGGFEAKSQGWTVGSEAEEESIRV